MNSTYNNLPLYTLDIDTDVPDEGGVDFVALVDRPAIKKGFLAFTDHEHKHIGLKLLSELSISFSENKTQIMPLTFRDDRRIVSGPLMLADTPIYRIDEEGEYYVSFPANVIERIAVKFYQQGKQANVNEMHDPSKKVEGVTMFESFLVDASRGIAPMQGYKDAPEGSWFGSFKVDNNEIWQSIKAGEYMGFSVEGMFSRYIPKNHPDSMAAFTEKEREQLAILTMALDFF